MASPKWSDSLLLELLEGDGGFPQQLLSSLDVAEDLSHKDGAGVLDRIEVGAQAVLLVLFLQPLEIGKPGVNPHQDPLETRFPSRAPPLLSTHDLVVAGLLRHRLDFEQRFMTSGAHGFRKPAHQVDGGIDPWLQGTRADQVDRD